MSWHEFEANLIYAKRGLSPFFALDAQVKELGGASDFRDFEHDGQRWQAKLYYQDSGIVVPDRPDFELEEMREFRLSVRRHPEEDELADPSEYDPDDRGGEQGFNAHVAPRWQGMEVESKAGNVSEYDVPQALGDAVNVNLKGSNIQPERYPELLRLAVDAVGVPGWNFDRLHDLSNIQDAERYVRLHKDASGPVHARDGPIASLYHLLTSDRSGYRKLVENDDDEQGRNLPGYYQTATLGEARIREAFPNQRLPKEIKHYYARRAREVSEGHPLRHPKVGASYQKSLATETLHWDDLDQLRNELDEVVRAVLVEAGIDLTPTASSGDFVPDAYFSATVSDGHPEPVALDLETLETTQESVVVRALSDGMSPVEWESLEMLVTDGGQVSPQNIADANDRHVDSVRRALRRMDDLVERKYGEVGLRSTRIAEMVHEAVDEARQATRRAVEAGAKAIDAAERGRDSAAAEFQAWAARHGVDIRRRGNDMTIDFSDYETPADRDLPPEVERKLNSAGNWEAALRTGFRLWKKAGQDASTFFQAKVQAPKGLTRASYVLSSTR